MEKETFKDKKFKNDVINKDYQVYDAIKRAPFIYSTAAGLKAGTKVKKLSLKEILKRGKNSLPPENFSKEGYSERVGLVEFCFSLEEAHRRIDSSISLLKKIKNSINDKNFHHFMIRINEKREIKAIITNSELASPDGFRQISPLKAEIIIESTENLGKDVCGLEGLWGGPTQKDVNAIQENLKVAQERYVARKSKKKKK